MYCRIFATGWQRNIDLFQVDYPKIPCGVDNKPLMT